ncbi:MAG: competence/damage-inducible protein A [Peptoclostridium sp.]|uniref:competence/damage-inducible protein A n=1 Tax=Peptoclostridium sp. TaxID=1904860 RepID=UPI00139BC6DE|nr:competence/damage-inducible protein A [Peptoclostridium sp.]MZQ76117.1 competence/damage-inducible protein A [Peptoclostridium sp.]
MVIEILSVGTELLLGDILNTNAQYISKKAAQLGMASYYQTVVGDNMDRINRALEAAFERADIVIATGGLGPTDDDLTKESAAEFFKLDMELDEYSWNKIKKFFEARGVALSHGNKKQAYFPVGSTIIPNDNGTAPGCIIEKDGKRMIILPGPPKEMEPMFDKSVEPYLKQFSDHTIVSETLRLCGIGESSAAEKIRDLLSGANPTVAPYAKEGEVIFRLTAKTRTHEEAQEMLEPLKREIYSRLGEYIYGEGETSLELEVGSELIERDLSIAVAESCTGGILSARLINCPGISQVFMEGCVAYSNAAKMNSLGVKASTLEEYGAVSEETAIEMARGAAAKNGSRVGISTTGIAGPDGGSEDKPVGLVYIGLYMDGVEKVKKLTLTGSRERIRNQAALLSLDFLRRELKGI